MQFTLRFLGRPLQWLGIEAVYAHFNLDSRVEEECYGTEKEDEA